jgi:hypothetical protein
VKFAASFVVVPTRAPAKCDTSPLILSVGRREVLAGRAERPFDLFFGMPTRPGLSLFVTLLGAACPLAAQTTAAVTARAAASPDHYEGNCPARIEFVGHVTVTVPGTRLAYRWERSDGDSGKLLHAQVGLPHPLPPDSATPPLIAALPSDFWRTGLPGHNGQYWEVLHILSPVDTRSAIARVDIECRN